MLFFTGLVIVGDGKRFALCMTFAVGGVTITRPYGDSADLTPRFWFASDIDMNDDALMHRRCRTRTKKTRCGVCVLSQQELSFQ